MSARTEAFNEVIERSSLEEALKKVVRITIHEWRADEALRWLGIADVHVGALRGPLGDRRALDRSRAAFEEFLDVCEVVNPHVVLIPGDIFHNKNIYNDERNLWNWFMSELLRKGYVVILQPGNHDFLSKQTSNLDYLQHFHDTRLLDNLYMASLDSQLLEISCNDKSKSVKILNAPCSVPMDLTEVSWANVVCFHGDVRGAIFDNGYDPASDPDYKDIRVSLPFKKADVFILGDIHKRQWVAKNAFYISAMFQTKFSEDQDKGYFSGTFDVVDKKFKWTAEPGILKSALPLITIDIQTDDQWPEESEWPTDCYIRLRYGTGCTLPDYIPENVIKRGILGFVRQDVSQEEIDDSELLDYNVALERLNDPYSGARELLETQEEIDLTEDEVQMAMDELDDIRATVSDE